MDSKTPSRLEEKWPKLLPKNKCHNEVKQKFTLGHIVLGEECFTPTPSFEKKIDQCVVAGELLKSLEL